MGVSVETCKALAIGPCEALAGRSARSRHLRRSYESGRIERTGQLQLLPAETRSSCLHDPDGIEVRLYLPAEAKPEGEQ